MDDLCPSCREPLDYPSGDGCAAMTKHKEKPMSDYNMTRKVSGEIVSRFASMLENLEDDYEEEIVVVSLMKQYKWAREESDEDLMWAIETVLSEYMTPSQFMDWMIQKKGRKDG